LQSEGLIQFPSINYPGTIREHATVAFDWPRNGKDGFADSDLLTVVFQKGSHSILKSRETSYIKTFDRAHCAVR